MPIIPPRCPLGYFWLLRAGRYCHAVGVNDGRYKGRDLSLPGCVASALIFGSASPNAQMFYTDTIQAKQSYLFDRLLYEKASQTSFGFESGWAPFSRCAVTFYCMF